MKRNIILKTLTVAILGTAALQVQAQGIYVNKKNHESIAYPKSVLDKVTPKSKQSSSTESPEWKWERIADMNTARMGHQIFPSGDGFVVVGGHTTDFQLTKTAEIYQNGKWTNISISNPHDGGFSVILGDGRVMVGGGFSSAKGVGQSKKTDIYDPKTQSFTAGPDMTVARAYAKAILMNGKVYVNGNWYADNKVMDCYDGSSFSSVGNMRNFTLPYIFASKSGTIWTWSLMDPWGETVDWGTSSSGSQGLLFNKYLVSTDETKSSLFTNMVTNVPLSLSEDVRMSNSYSAKDDRYYFLTKNSNSYKLYYSLIDESSIGWYNFDVPTVYPNTDVEINYRGSVFVNDAKEEVYLVGSNGPSNNQTLFLVCYNFADENVVHRTIAKIDGFEHNLMSGAWTILNDGRLVCTGGGINSNFDAQKYAYIFTPPTSTGSGADENGVDVWKKDGSHDTYLESELESITTYEEKFDERITQEIPIEYLSKMSAYMPIYSGNTPPNIEGTYNLSKQIMVYNSDPNSSYQAGKKFVDYVSEFTKQDMTANTVQYRYEERNANGPLSSSEIVEAKVLGQNNTFTIFTVTKANYTDGAWTKNATILSGAMTNSGIKDFYRGILMLDKYDPNSNLMNIGDFRIFKDEDGLSEPTTWMARQRATSMKSNTTETQSLPISTELGPLSVKQTTCGKEKAIELK